MAQCPVCAAEMYSCPSCGNGGCKTTSYASGVGGAGGPCPNCALARSGGAAAYTCFKCGATESSFAPQ